MRQENAMTFGKVYVSTNSAFGLSLAIKMKDFLFYGQSLQ
jgi:hypothetical protein